MSNIQTGTERMPDNVSNLGVLAGQIKHLITISTTPVIAGDSFEMDAVGALRLSPLRRGLAIDSTVDIFTFYVPHRHVYGEQWIKFMKDGVNATPLPTVNTTGYIDHAAFLGTIIFFQAEDGIRYLTVTGVQTCALPIFVSAVRVFEARYVRRDHRIDRIRSAPVSSGPTRRKGADALKSLGGNPREPSLVRSSRIGGPRKRDHRHPSLVRAPAER